MTKKILVAEDEWELRKLLRLILEDYDFEVIEAENAEQIIKYAHSAKPDLIMLDSNLNGIDGNGILKNIPVIMLGGRNYNEKADKINDFNFIEYVEKPYEDWKILNALKKVLGALDKKEVKAAPIIPTMQEKIAEQEGKTNNDTETTTKYYNLHNVSLKKVIGVICGVKLPDDTDGFSGRSVLLVVYSANPDVNLMDKIVDVFGNSMPVLLIDNKSFNDKYDKLASLGLKMFEIEPEAFRRV